jgi:hypothetical protein
MSAHHPPEASIALLRHGYRWSERIRAAAGDDVDPDAVPVRMLGRPAVMLRGPDGVRAFTDTDLVRRHGAVPGAVADVLFGKGAVHGLDDADHLRRKALFVRATPPAAVQALVDEVELRWLAATRSWTPGREVVIEDEAVRVIGRAVLHWAGIELPASEADRVARRFATIVDGFGVVGAANLEARWSRRRSDAWALRVIHAARRGDPVPRRGSVLELAAWWRDADGHLLPARTAAVELQNVLRPTVAVARFVAFAPARSRWPSLRRCGGPRRSSRRWRPWPGASSPSTTRSSRRAPVCSWTSSGRCGTVATGRTHVASTRTASSADRRSWPTPSSRRVVARWRRATAAPARTSRWACWRSPAACSRGRTGTSRPRTSTSPSAACPPAP